jgi:hypothetical protein
MTNLPAQWRAITTVIAAAMSGEPTHLLGLFTHPVLEILNKPRTQGDLSRQAVSCNDVNPHAKDFNATADILTETALDVLKNVSPRFALSLDTFETDSGCQFWPVQSVERFTGPWNHTLSKKILIASNRGSPLLAHEPAIAIASLKLTPPQLDP